MAITHSGWLTADRELNRAAKTTAIVKFSVVHDLYSLYGVVERRAYFTPRKKVRGPAKRDKKRDKIADETAGLKRVGCNGGSDDVQDGILKGVLKGSE